ncbi:uncharacterized protein LOC128219554 [Mya arenaria]|uniref:uncharacterized protein LOC128219554 n=1 Tax=Mya arenaria TaxID=6604 RepID=UPI0022E9762C|nr:uncharacterized protein LOC128219554 [Mya arenaria]
MKELLTCFILAVLVNQAHSACSATLGDVTAELASLANISTADPTAAYDGLNQTCSSLNKKRNSSDCTWEELDALIDIRIHLLTARPELQVFAPAFRNLRTLCVDNCYRPWLGAMTIKPHINNANFYLTVRAGTGYQSCSTVEIRETIPCVQGMTPPCYKTTAVKNCTFADGLYREVANISYICHLPDTFFDMATEVISGWVKCKANVTDKPFGDAVDYDRFTLTSLLALKMDSCNKIRTDGLSCKFLQSSSPEFKLCMSNAQRDYTAISDSDKDMADLRCRRNSCADEFITECNVNESKENVSRIYMLAANIRNGHVFDLYCDACANIMASAYVIMASLLIFWTL